MSGRSAGTRALDARMSAARSLSGERAADVSTFWWSAGSRERAGEPCRPAAVVELIGPPGAGKTTLRRGMLALEPRSLTIRIDRRRDLAVVAEAALGLLLPVVAGVARRHPVPSWRDAVQLTRLRALWPAVARAVDSGAPLVLLDEGPVYALAKLEAYAHVADEAGFFGARWRSALARWREALDVVVWLDAPDELLVHRIRDRAKAHPVKVAGTLEAAHFISRYRAAYDVVAARLCTAGGPRLLRIDTSTGDGAEHAARLLGTLGVSARLRDAAE